MENYPGNCRAYRKAIEGEGWAIVDYTEMIARATSDREREILTHIRDEEKEHLEELLELTGAKKCAEVI